LNAQGSRTRSGQPWRFEYVRNLVAKTAAAVQAQAA
jgi:YD repeat-containing protein